ncbi:endonuclease III [Halobacteriales archaeon QS_1_68_44]|nr:MAG: endonuclease III [Halobacteriales archaeon QS_1_68_44]
MSEEPAENISGGAAGGGRAASFDPAAADTHTERVVDRLGELYWTKTYGGRDAFECLVRTVLSQNTSDRASQPAHDALMDRYGSEGASDPGGGPASEASGTSSDYGPDGEDDLAATLADARQDELAETISSAGLYNQKSETLIRLAGRVREEYSGGDGFDKFVAGGDPEVVRDALLEMKGVGPKTADCVLLFAGGQAGVFPVDTHVHRIARRMGLAPADADHETVREHLEAAVPAEKCGFGHTAMIQFGREYCTARKPACLEDPEACPMADLCDQAGVYPETGEVVDPMEAPEADD